MSFTDASGQTVDKTFTISAVDAAFGVVQKTAAAISQQRWDDAAALDRRIAAELEKEGPDFLKAEYPPEIEKHWYPSDPSGNDNDVSTTIIGAYIAYDKADDRTYVYCEIWSVDLNGDSMRSDQITQPDNKDKQVSSESSGRHPPSDASNYVENDCVNAVHPS